MKILIILFICINLFQFYVSSSDINSSNVDIEGKTEEVTGYGGSADQRKTGEGKNGGGGGGGGGGGSIIACPCAGSAGNLINQLVILVVTVLAQLLNAVVTIVQCLLGVDGINSLVGNILTNALPGVVGVLNNLVNIIGQTLGNITG